MPEQQQLFETEPAPWEADAAAAQLVATVVLGEGPAGEYDYLVPDHFLDDGRPEQLLEPGRRALVPFGRGNRPTIAYCIRLESKSVNGRRLKRVGRVLDVESLLTPALVRLTRWMADYYLCSWGQVLQAVVPSEVRRQAGTREVALLSVPMDVAENLSSLKLPPKQRACLELLAAGDAPLTAGQLAEAAGCTAAPIRQLLRKGLIEAKRARVATSQLDEVTAERQAPLELNNDQQQALGAIVGALEAGGSQGIVLHGVTGSGKTEVYLQAIERVVSFGRQAIVLVPEISLTPQTVRRFRARFDGVAVLHSHQSAIERRQHWERIAHGKVQVVVGARSAVFAPTRHLGLIVIDEEHEGSFKQDSAPRYHARDVAWQRTQAEGIPLVLGSATPSLEAWQRAATGEFQLMTVDLRDPGHARGGRGGISRPLHQAMVATLRDDGQVILLLNRRGFSTHIQCPACGYAVKCPDCEMSLTFHRQHSVALCHYCDHQESPPTRCPDCQSHAIRYGGLGTQKLEAEVRARFPEHVCARMDTDSMRVRGSHERVLSAFRQGEIDILLGTQMIAKGLDFPNVTLVGVITADTALHLADFRAGERTFQLVAQVAGRTGRGDRGGRVLVQTLSPDHRAIVAAVRHDYRQFAEAELASRKAHHYPPFGAMIRIVVRGPTEAVARETAEEFANQLRQSTDGAVRILGPAPAPIPKLRRSFRFQLQLQADEGELLRCLVERVAAALPKPDGVHLAIDVDPLDMM
jgi:primosomal protein N' (replication factor Y) (superfamily II helicase)